MQLGEGEVLPFRVEELAWLDHIIEAWSSGRQDLQSTSRPGGSGLVTAAQTSEPGKLGESRSLEMSKPVSTC